MSNINKEKGAGVLLVFGVIFVVIIVGILIVNVMVSPPEDDNGEKEEEDVFEAQYEVMAGNMKFIFKEAIDMGSVLRTGNPRSEDLVTTERFIKVTIGAVNEGTNSIAGRDWEVEKIIDEEGRIFEPLREFNVREWLPEDNGCHTIVHPGFSPKRCTQIYEVANISERLKAKVVSSERGDDGEDFIDLFVIPASNL